jgi:hypothetical protein
MSISVNGKQVGQTSVTARHSSDQWQVFGYTATTTGLPTNISIRYLNDQDGGTATTDRNLYVQSVTVDGKTLTPAQGTSTFKGASTSGSQLMPTDGTLAWQNPINLPPETLKVIVIASGDTYLAPPNMGIRVNGLTVAQTSVTSAHASNAWQTFTYTFTMPVPLISFGVSFTNDAYGGNATIDRNLYVKSVTVNGTTFMPWQGLYTHGGGAITAVGTTELTGTGTLTWDANLLKK